MPSPRSLAGLVLLIPTLAAAQTLSLIPLPREIHPTTAQPIPQGLRIVCTPCFTDPEDNFTATDLAAALAARSIPSSGPFTINLTRTSNLPPEMQPEGYTITPGQNSLTLAAASAPGLFYAAQTLKQLIENDGPAAILHLASIRDWPAMKYRGLHDDLSRGPVPTLAFQKHLIQVLAAHKANLYSPYFESNQQYLSDPLAAPPGGAVSPAEARELSAFAARYHVLVVPEQEAFGHLRHVLLWEQYAAVAETPHGAVLAPVQPASIDIIKRWFTELAADYPNSPFLHLGADETIDLGLGQTKADVDSRGRAAVYLDFMARIVTALQPLHRRLLFWGDIAQDAPAQLKAMPQSFKDNTIAVAWGYSPSPTGFERQIRPFTAAGIETWVAPSINNYRQVFPNYNLALPDIQQFTRDGQRFGATGQLNTLWNDDGESLADMNWYGILFGAAAAWQQGESSIPAFQQAFGPVFHGDRTGKINQAQLELTAAMNMLSTARVISPTEGTDGLFWVDPWTSDGTKFAARMRPLAAPLRLHAERAITLIAQARAAYPLNLFLYQENISVASNDPPGGQSFTPSVKSGVSTEARPQFPAALRYADTPAASNPANAFPSPPTSLHEPNALDALEFAARRIDFLALKFQLADEMASGYARAFTAATSSDPLIHRTTSRELSDINGVNGRLQDIRDTYAQLRDLFAQTWLRTDRPYALRPVLAHFDAAIALWQSRSDRLRSAQRQYADLHTLPTPTDVGIPHP